MNPELTYLAGKREDFRVIHIPALPGESVYTHYEKQNKIKKMIVHSIVIQEDNIMYDLQFKRDNVTIDFQTTSEEVFLSKSECKRYINIKSNKIRGKINETSEN